MRPFTLNVAWLVGALHLSLQAASLNRRNACPFSVIATACLEAPPLRARCLCCQTTQGKKEIRLLSHARAREKG